MIFILCKNISLIWDKDDVYILDMGRGRESVQQAKAGVISGLS